MLTSTCKQDEFKDHFTETDGFTAQYFRVELLRLLVNTATVQTWLWMTRPSLVDLYRSLMLTGASLNGVLGVSPSCHFALPESRVCGSFLHGENLVSFELAAFPPQWSWILSVGLAFAARFG